MGSTYSGSVHSSPRASVVLLRLALCATLSLPLFSPWSVSAAQDTALQSPSSPDAHPHADQQSVKTELEHAIHRLTVQITEQHRMLSAAQTEREHGLIQTNIQFLEEERHTLEDLFAQIVGVDYENFENAQEQQAEHRATQYDNVLEGRAKQ